MISKIQELVEKLGWDENDDVSIELAGTAISGIDVGEDYNKKWQSPLGTIKYNKDAFIVIKNLTRTPFAPSQPNPELIGHHAKETRQGDQGDNGSNSVGEPEVSA